MPRREVVLTIAGSDSGGGAGIQADLKTFHHFGVFGTSALSAVTAQNTLGVTVIHIVPPDVFQAQLDAVITDLHPRAAKTGMLATRDHIKIVVETLMQHRIESVVVDPVMVATSGDKLLQDDARAAMTRDLVPLATVVTPNIPEAEELLDGRIQTVQDMLGAAREIVAMGAKAALITGGHLGGESVADVYCDGQLERVFSRPRIKTTSTHGTGCTLSAAIAACLARGMPAVEAVERAGDYVHRAVETAPGLGAGHGPINHFAQAGVT